MHFNLVGEGRERDRGLIWFDLKWNEMKEKSIHKHRWPEKRENREVCVCVCVCNVYYYYYLLLMLGIKHMLEWGLWIDQTHLMHSQSNSIPY